jgi:hypothetical protein
VQIKVWLLGISPMVWRRVLVSSSDVVCANTALATSILNVERRTATKICGTPGRGRIVGLIPALAGCIKAPCSKDDP